MNRGVQSRRYAITRKRVCVCIVIEEREEGRKGGREEGRRDGDFPSDSIFTCIYNISTVTSTYTALLKVCCPLRSTGSLPR